MSKDSLFIVIEGLDGSGKTTIGRQLAIFLNTIYPKQVKLSFEPHDASTSGLFIRQILEKKIKNFSHRTLALAFAANRMDHGTRVVNKWLDAQPGQIVICDRYYLSSLVYQTTDETPMEEVMHLNRKARKPDVIFFMNVSNEVCYSRMDTRNKPKELFEENLTETREKFLTGIDFLRTTRQENIIEINANGTRKSVLEQMVNALYQLNDSWQDQRLLAVDQFQIQTEDASSFLEDQTIVKEVKALEVSARKAKMEQLEPPQKGALFLHYLQEIGYQIKDRLLWADQEVYGLTYSLPGGLEQRGTALLVSSEQRYDVILNNLSQLKDMTDFMFVFIPGPSESVTEYYEREVVQFTNAKTSLSPNMRLVTEADLLGGLIKD